MILNFIHLLFIFNSLNTAPPGKIPEVFKHIQIPFGNYVALKNQIISNINTILAAVHLERSSRPFPLFSKILKYSWKLISKIKTHCDY